MVEPIPEMKPRIIATRFKGGAFVPLSPKAVERDYKDGDLCFLHIDRERYMPRHRWFMALVRECFETLPEHLRNEFGNHDILRKRLLIAAGYRDVVKFPMKNEQAAKLCATEIAARVHDFTIISVRDEIVTLITAKSQKLDAMDNDTFTKSCDKCLDELALLLAVDRQVLTDRATELQITKKRTRKQAQSASAGS